MEIGPWRIDGQGGLVTVEGGWEEYTHMVYGKCACRSPWHDLLMSVQWTNLRVQVSRTLARIIMSIRYLRPQSK